MLINPKHGWVTICIDNWSDRASYLTDVPLDCLDAMIYALTNKCDFIVSFDAEGWTYKIISDCYRTFIIEEQNKPKLITIENVDINMLAKELYNDISKDLDEWSNWSCSLDVDEDGKILSKEIENYKQSLVDKLYQLKILLKD